MLSIVLICATTVIWNLFQTQLAYALDEDVHLSSVEIIQKYGYPVEIYSDVSTEDDYLLDVYRIPHGRTHSKNESGTPAILMHALMATSKNFLMSGPERSLAFLLADRGYDVWLPNARGSTYSRKHLTLDPDRDRQFWFFMLKLWHEIGHYDLPAIFELVGRTTKRKRFIYIGFSQGTTSYYVFLSTRPEYNRNVSFAISLAPQAYMSTDVNAGAQIAIALEPLILPIVRFLGTYEFPPKFLMDFFHHLNKNFCIIDGFPRYFCSFVLDLMGGNEPRLKNARIVPDVIGMGTTAASYQIIHYGQILVSETFRQFNFGRTDNLQRYGSPIPPSYNLTKITSKNYFIYSTGDTLVSPRGVHRICREITRCKGMFEISNPYFNHLDFLLAHEATHEVYVPLFQILDKRNKPKREKPKGN